MYSSPGFAQHENRGILSSEDDVSDAGGTGDTPPHEPSEDDGAMRSKPGSEEETKDAEAEDANDTGIKRTQRTTRPSINLFQHCRNRCLSIHRPLFRLRFHQMHLPWLFRGYHLKIFLKKYNGHDTAKEANSIPICNQRHCIFAGTTSQKMAGDYRQHNWR
jgi:hypothetical protein